MIDLDLAAIHRDEGAVTTCLTLLEIAEIPWSGPTPESPLELLSALRSAPMGDRVAGNEIIELVPLDHEPVPEAGDLDIIAHGNQWDWQMAVVDADSATPSALMVDIDGATAGGIERYGKVDLGDFLLTAIAVSVVRGPVFGIRTLVGIDNFAAHRIAARPEPSLPVDYCAIAAGPGWVALDHVSMAWIGTWGDSDAADASRLAIGGPDSYWKTP